MDREGEEDRKGGGEIEWRQIWKRRTWTTSCRGAGCRWRGLIKNSDPRIKMRKTSWRWRRLPHHSLPYYAPWPHTFLHHFPISIPYPYLYSLTHSLPFFSPFLRLHFFVKPFPPFSSCSLHILRNFTLFYFSFSLFPHFPKTPFSYFYHPLDSLRFPSLPYSIIPRILPSPPVYLSLTFPFIFLPYPSIFFFFFPSLPTNLLIFPYPFHLSSFFSLPFLTHYPFNTSSPLPFPSPFLFFLQFV